MKSSVVGGNAATPTTHLVVDAGAGFLAVGVLLALAAAWHGIRLLQAAFAASLAHDVPHTAYHLMHPAGSLTAGAKAVSTGGLVAGCVVAAALLALVSFRSDTSHSPT